MTEQNATPRLGISGRLAAAFQANPLTPILAIMGLLLGLLAVAITPREEEPQIDVTMANVIVPFDGASARDVEQLVSVPLEQKLSEIEGIKHVYSISRPGMSIVTVEYEVGVDRQPALVRLYNQVYSNQDWLPPGFGVGTPIVKPKGIDDVPVMAVTLWSDDPATDATRLAEVAHTLEAEVKRIPGTRDVYTIGAPDRSVLVTLDAARLAAYQLSPADLVQALRAANVVHQAGERVTAAGAVPVTAGRFLSSADDVASLVVGSNGGKPLLPFVYSDEVWTGIEYQVAAHLIMLGETDKGLEIVRVCRKRYDGVRRNPFNEYECGHWYARALSSYALLEALSGVRYDAVEKALRVRPGAPEASRSFLCADTGYGTLEVAKGVPSVKGVVGSIEVRGK